MKIAVINTPFSTHIGRLEFAFRALQDQGHELELWGSGATAAIAARLDAVYREIPLRTDFSALMQRRLKPHEIFTELFFGIAREQLDTVLDYCERYAPDVIEANSRVFSASAAAMKTGIALVTHCCSGNSFSQIPDDLYGFCVKGDESARQLRIMRQLSLEFFRVTDTWFNEHIARPYGLGTVENAIGLCSRDFAVAQTIAALSKPRIASLPNVYLTGPIVTESRTQEDFSQYVPYCYVSLGTSPWNKAEIADRYRALAQLVPPPIRIVIGLGGLLAADELGIDDERVTVYEQAPQIEAIKHSEFIVCHGGCQTVHEALYLGKPIIGIPHHAEISEMVNSVELAGAGVRIAPSQVNRRSIEEAIASVTADSTRKRAAGLAAELRTTDGLTGVLDVFNRVADAVGRSR